MRKTNKSVREAHRIPIPEIDIDTIVERVAARLAETAQIDEDIDEMQHVIEGDRVYMTTYVLQAFRNRDSTAATQDIMNRFPHYDIAEGKRYGLIDEWANVDPATDVTSELLWNRHANPPSDFAHLEEIMKLAGISSPSKASQGNYSVGVHRHWR